MSTLDNSGGEEPPTERTHLICTLVFSSELPVVNFVLQIFETSVLLVRYKAKRALIIQNCVQSDFTPTLLSLLHSSLVPSPSPQLSSLAVRITWRRRKRKQGEFILLMTIAAVEEWEPG